jgi:Protein of unknown function (DUF3485)
MPRVFPLLTALAVIFGTGVIHGLWTNRWQGSPELAAAVARLDRAPNDLGPWKAQKARLDPTALKQARAAGSWARTFVHETTRNAVGVFLLCGPGGPMAVHRPEHCYQGAGYEMIGSPTPYRLKAAPGEMPNEFWTARFRQQTATGPVELRIFWSWSNGAAWQAPANPRLSLPRYPALYKLYVVRELHSPQERLADDPATELLARLIPELTRALSQP